MGAAVTLYADGTQRQHGGDTQVVSSNGRALLEVALNWHDPELSPAVTMVDIRTGEALASWVKAF